MKSHLHRKPCFSSKSSVTTNSSNCSWHENPAQGLLGRPLGGSGMQRLNPPQPPRLSSAHAARTSPVCPAPASSWAGLPPGCLPKLWGGRRRRKSRIKLTPASECLSLPAPTSPQQGPGTGGVELAGACWEGRGGPAAASILHPHTRAALAAGVSFCSQPPRGRDGKFCRKGMLLRRETQENAQPTCSAGFPCSQQGDSLGTPAHGSRVAEVEPDRC